MLLHPSVRQSFPQIGQKSWKPYAAARTTLAAFLILPMGVLADEAAKKTEEADNVLPQVTVTAERRATSLQRTPVAVGSLDDKYLTEKNITQVKELSGVVSGLFIPKTNSVGVQPIYIRGIGTAAPIYNGAVAVYVDDVYIPRIINSGVFGSPDIGNIEVLRGPQGTLYGQNSSAGAIKIISLTPDEKTKSWVSLGLGDYDAKVGKLYLSGELAPNLLYGSIAYSHQSNEGFINNKTLNKRVGGLDVDQVRAKLRFTPSETLDVVLSVDGMKDRSDNAYATPITPIHASKRTTYDDKKLSQHNEAVGTSLKIEKQLTDNLLLRSISAYRGFENSPNTWSSDGIPGDISGFQLNIDQDQRSQEFQLQGEYDRLDFTVGAIAFNEHYKVDRPSWTAESYRGVSTNTNVNSQGVYAQGHYKLTDALGATLGIRYTQQKDRYDWTGYNTDASLDSRLITSTLSGQKHTTHGVLGKAGIDYQWSPDVFTYFSLTQGEKAGGYNPVPASLAVAKIPVEPENVLAYEAGIKVTSWNGRVQSNLSVFYNDFDDYQATVRNPIVNGEQLNISVIVNAGKAKTYGAELENNVLFTPNLTWRSALTVLQAEFLEFQNPTGSANTDYKGNHLPRTPRFLLGTGVDYKVPLSIPGQIRLTADALYTTHSYEDIANTDRVSSNLDVNLGAFYVTADKHWTTSLNVRNALDRTYRTTQNSNSSLGLITETYNPPRTLLASIRYDF